MRTLMTLLGTVMFGGLVHAQSALEIPDEPLARIQVVDEQGQPIRTAKVHVSASMNDTRYMATAPAWQFVNARGVCVVEGSETHRLRLREVLEGRLPVELQAMIAAPGYVPLHFERAANPREPITATLKPARSFELRLLTASGEPVNLRMSEDLYQEHRSSPLLIGSTDNKPICALGERQSERSRFQNAPPLCLNFGIYPLGEGRYRVDVPQAFTGALMLMVHSPEVVRYYMRTLEPDEWQSGSVEVRLPKPSTMVLELDLEAWRKAYKDFSELSLSVMPPGSAQSSLMFYSDAFVGRQFSGGLVVERNVAPGTYQALLYLWNKDTHQKTLQVPEGGVVRQKIAPKPFDVADYRGKRQVRVQIQRAGGKSVAGARYRVDLTRGYGQARTLQEGKLDKNGAFVLRNLYENPANTDAFNAVGYRIYVNGKFARYFTLTQGDGVRDLQITLAPQPGDPAINFTATDLRTGKPVELRTLRGKWVYLEFWATWCGPCQTAMEELKAFVEKQPDSWRKQVVVLTVSVDQDKEVVLPHLQKRGWDKFALHAWDEGQRAAQQYGVEGIPTAFLIDPQGKVVWAGNPLTRQQESLLRQIGNKGGAR
jgi:thiol-disulfide isomerase/thioredoxin